MAETVIIDGLPESISAYRHGYAVVAIDVIRATTTVVTSVAMGRRCFPVPSLDAALQLASRLHNPLLVGEVAGTMPDGFDLNNSPAEMAERKDIYRPIILLSSSGTRLVYGASQCKASYVACFRNYGAVARHLIGRHSKVAIIGAGSRGEFREEDQMCCAWIAEELINAGYKSKDRRTQAIVKRWSGVPPTACLGGKSAEYLRSTGQLRDLDFVLTHITDLDVVLTIQNNEAVVVPSSERLDGEKDDRTVTPTGSL